MNHGGVDCRQMCEVRASGGGTIELDVREAVAVAARLLVLGAGSVSAALAEGWQPGCAGTGGG